MKLIENMSILPLDEYIKSKTNWDICLSCGSFEQRCLKSSEQFVKGGVSFKTSIILVPQFPDE